MRFITNNVTWEANDDHVINRVFDFNFSISWNSGYTGYGDYLSGLTNATSYKNVSADVYGAALHNNFWKGRRLMYEKIN